VRYAQVVSLCEVVSLRDITAALPPSPRPWATSLAIAIFVVDSYKRASEGQYLTEGDENRMVYLRQRWKDKARGKHYAPEGAQCKRCEELNIFSHCIRKEFYAAKPQF
jgi:hypothetical protein